MTWELLKVRKLVSGGSRPRQLQSPDSLKALADRFASSRYSDSPKAKQLPLPPVHWINDGSSLDHFNGTVVNYGSVGFLFL